MNDETLELLSSYLDGALPVAQVRELESRLAASAELRAALAELRAVSKAVKDLPREPLPAGFMARLQARRARGEEPQKNWVFLPPMMRPVALAMSCGVVALVIWDKVAVAPPADMIRAPYSAKVLGADSAPVSQVDVSGMVAGSSKIGVRGMDSRRAAAESSAALGILSAGSSEPAGFNDSVPTVAQAEPAKAERAYAAPKDAFQPASAPSRAMGRPFDGASGGASVAGERGRYTMSEEERSSRNERMFGALEREKKKMGIAKVLTKEDSRAAVRGSLLAGAPQAPAAPMVRALAPTLLKKAPADGRIDAPSARADGIPGRPSQDAGLVLTDARGLLSSWTLLGFPGAPPMTDFSAGRLILIKPSATKILSVTTNPGAVVVVYRSIDPDEASDPASDRVAPIPADPKTVLIFDATPR